MRKRDKRERKGERKVGAFILLKEFIGTLQELMLAF